MIASMHVDMPQSVFAVRRITVSIGDFALDLGGGSTLYLTRGEVTRLVASLTAALGAMDAEAPESVPAPGKPQSVVYTRPEVST